MSKMNVQQNRVDDRDVTINQDSSGIHFEGPTQVRDIINDSIIIQLSKPSFWGNALREWNENIFHWSEAPEDARANWAGMMLHGLSCVERVDPKIVFQGLGTIALWILTAWLIAPILAWPQNDGNALLRNAIAYGIASLLIPLLIALFTVPDQIEAHHIPTSKKKWALQLLKFTGAVCGFLIVSISLIGCTLIAYYAGMSVSSPIVRNGLVLLPLLFSHVGARMIPAGRLKMYDGEFKLHSADRFFFITFSCLGPAFALVLYGMADFLNDKFLGASVFLMVGLVASLWEYKKRASDELPDPIAIFFFGIILPAYIVMVALLYPGPPYLPRQEWPSFGMVIVYLLSETILMATLLIRKQVKLTERGRTSAILVGVLIDIILLINAWLYRMSLWPTVIVVMAMAILWQFWGQKRFEHHARIHPSFWVMQAILGISLYVLMQGSVALWLNVLVVLPVAGTLIWWAYGRGNSEQRALNSELNCGYHDQQAGSG